MHQLSAGGGVVHFDVEGGDVGVGGRPPHCQRRLQGSSRCGVRCHSYTYLYNKQCIFGCTRSRVMRWHWLHCAHSCQNRRNANSSCGCGHHRLCCKSRKTAHWQYCMCCTDRHLANDSVLQRRRDLDERCTHHRQLCGVGLVNIVLAEHDPVNEASPVCDIQLHRRQQRGQQQQTTSVNTRLCQLMVAASRCSSGLKKHGRCQHSMSNIRLHSATAWHAQHQTLPMMHIPCNTWQ